MTDRTKLFHGGRVLTGVPKAPPATAVLVSDGRIAAVGGDELASEASERAELVDLEGAALLPGFIDPHTHFSFSLVEPISVDCSTPPLERLADVLGAIGRWVDQAPGGGWVRGWGFHASQVAEGRPPSRAELDEVAPDNPFVLVDVSFHACYVNSAALRLGQIDRHTPDPRGGEIVRNGDGEPTGTLLETAVEFAQEGSWLSCLRGEPEHLLDLVAAHCERFLALGLTAVGDALVLPPARDLYRRAAAAGKLTIGVSQYFGGDSFFATPEPQSLPRQDEADGGSLLAGDGIKLFLDSSYPTPAIDRRLPGGEIERLGELRYQPAELTRILGAAASRDLDVAIHCGGSRAVGVALDAFAAIRDSTDARFRIEHAFVDDRKHAGRYAEAGVMLVSQPAIGAAYGELFDAWRGDDQEGLVLFPARSISERGGTVAASSDYPCGPLGPLTSMLAATERPPPLDPEEAVEPATALAMCTIEAARACGREGAEGSIAPGKRANLVVLDRDPTRDVAAMRSAEVLQTWVDGRLMHERPDAAP